MCRVWANMDPKIYDYFFHHVLTGDRGAKQALINIFFEKLYEHCMFVENIPPHWDVDNEARVAAVVSRLNFREQQPSNHITSTESGNKSPRNRNGRRKPVKSSPAMPSEDRTTTTTED